MALACAGCAAQAQRRHGPVPPAAAADPISSLVGQLDLEKYKATIKSLTRFGDRRQGTEATVRRSTDRSATEIYGCANTKRLQYSTRKRRRRSRPSARPAFRAARRRSTGPGRQHPVRHRIATGVNNDRWPSPTRLRG